MLSTKIHAPADTPRNPTAYQPTGAAAHDLVGDDAPLPGARAAADARAGSVPTSDTSTSGHLVEHPFCALKRYHAIASRCDKIWGIMIPRAGTSLAAQSALLRRRYAAKLLHEAPL